MFNKVVNPKYQTTYGSSFIPKQIQKVKGRNLSTASTTNNIHYTSTPKTLYQTDIVEKTQEITYQRPKNFKKELVQLPDEFNSTIKPNLETSFPNSTYKHCFCNSIPSSKQNLLKPRSLSRLTQSECEGTTKVTHYPPGYSGHIPKEWKGNRGKEIREDRNVLDYSWQYHTQKTGYSGYIPISNTIDTSNMKKSNTTYREMCSSFGYDI